MYVYLVLQYCNTLRTVLYFSFRRIRHRLIDKYFSQWRVRVDMANSGMRVADSIEGIYPLPLPSYFHWYFIIQRSIPFSLWFLKTIYHLWLDKLFATQILKPKFHFLDPASSTSHSHLLLQTPWVLAIPLMLRCIRDRPVLLNRRQYQLAGS